jgi:predicted metal-dependent peptidase
MKYDIERLKRKMFVKYPFFGSVVANVSYKEDTTIKTAETDGKTIYYNPNFLNTLNVSEQTFVFAHEVCHIAFNHILRSEGKDEYTWNIATDGVINQFLKRDGLEMVEGCVDIKDAINYDAEELYEKLIKDKEQEQKKEQAGHDSHNMWKDAIKKFKEETTLTEQEKQIKEKQEQTKKMGEKDSFKENLAEKKRKLEKLKREILKEVSQRGKTSNSVIRTINDIGKSKPIVDWRYILKETITYNADWSYKNAEIEDGVISANLEEQPHSETEILLDTSGSISDFLLRGFLRECKNILQTSKLKVGCFDTKFYGFHEIRTEQDIENMQFEGGGGTDFCIAVNSFTKRVENKIIFTDGHAQMPDTPIDAIWIVFGFEKIRPKGGKVIYISPQDLDKLYTNELQGRSR